MFVCMDLLVVKWVYRSENESTDLLVKFLLIINVQPIEPTETGPIKLARSSPVQKILRPKWSVRSKNTVNGPVNRTVNTPIPNTVFEKITT